MPYLVVGVEAVFVMNGNVITRNIIEYAPKRQLPSFYYDKSVSTTETKSFDWTF